ncbi:MAG: PqqD family peptide modification chaperone [Rubrivivax sp.]|nr:MAG: PqqD family peptide modification chaperone [Rubrivivax sp.]
MQDTLLSPYWYRISGLHPRLRPHVQVRMQTTRGQAWYVLHNQATGRFHRVNAQAYELVGRLDGRFTVDDIWQVLLGHLGDDAPSQHDVIRILGQLTDAGLVQAEVTPDVRQMLAADEQRTQREQRSRLNPLSFRLGLFNPSALLERLQPVVRLAFQPWVMMVWLALVTTGAVLTALNLRDILPYAQRNFMSPAFLAMAWVVYPLMKGLHELGHALALRRHHCEVPEVGVNFFLFVPLPYVDASASNRLVNRWHRVQISAAGIAVELALASLALGLWLLVEDGWVRQLAFVAMTVGGLSTLMFNGNPLMKFDGYFVACDALDLPNLSNRSAKAFAQLMRGMAMRLLRMDAPPENQVIHGADRLERWALWAYAPLSWVYRLGVTAIMVVWASEKSSWLGLGILVWSVWTLLVTPGRAWLDQLMQSPGFERVRGRAMLGGGTVALALAGLVAFVPLPSSMVIEGLVWLPEHAQVRAASDGEVDTVWVRSGQHVVSGQPVVSVQDPELLTRQAVLQAQIDSLENELHGTYTSDALRMKNAQDALVRDRAALAQVEKDLSRQVLRAGVAGEFVMPRQEDLERHQVSRGELLAFVLADEPSVIRAVVPQRQVDAVRHRVKSISVVLDEQPGKVWPARMISEVPAAADRLPSAALGDRSGGRVATDGADPDGLRPTEPQFVIDLALQNRIPRAGGLARVRLALQPQPLLTTMLQGMRQLFLKHFSDVKA